MVVRVVTDTDTATHRSERTILARFKLLPRQANRIASILLISQMSVAAGALLVNVVSARALGPSGRGALALHLQLTYVVTAVVLVFTMRRISVFRPEES